MPKMKTHKGTAKRFRKTGSGKWIRPKAWRGHHLRDQVQPPHASLRRLATVSRTHHDALEVLMPYAGKEQVARWPGSSAASPRTPHKRLLNAAEGVAARVEARPPAREALIHALVYAYRDRRDRKRDMRRLWIERINAAVPPARGLPTPLHQRAEGAGVEVDPEDPGRHGRPRARRVRGHGRDRQVLLYHPDRRRPRRSPRPSRIPGRGRSFSPDDVSAA